MSRPLHPGDAMSKISLKRIRSIDIPVTCGHWTIIARVDPACHSRCQRHLSLLGPNQPISGLTSVLPSSERHPLERFFRPWQSLG